MDLQHSVDDEAFRAEVRAFLEAHLPADIAHRHALGFHPVPKADLLAWNRILAEKGWAAAITFGFSCLGFLCSRLPRF